MATPWPHLNPNPGEPIRWTIGPYAPDRQNADPNLVMAEVYMRQKEVVAAHAAAKPPSYRNFRQRVAPVLHGPGDRRFWERFWRRWNETYMHCRDSFVGWVRLEVKLNWYMPFIRFLWECFVKWGLLVLACVI
jgi:hypothetical protein